jgi:hypothetical protein
MQPLVRKLFEEDQRQGGGLLDLYGNSYNRALGLDQERRRDRRRYSRGASPESQQRP